MFALKVFLFSVLMVLITAQDNKQPVQILSETKFINANGYNFEFKTSDGVSRQEEAKLITVGNYQGIGVKGSYSYTAPDGVQYLVTFTADDKGFKPQIRVASPENQ